VLGQRAVRLLGLAPFPLDKQWDAPTVKVLEAASHVGRVLVYSSPSLRVEVGTLAGIRPERLSPAPGEIAVAAGGAPLSFAFWDENFELPLRVIPRRGTMQASVATLVEISHAGLALRCSMTVEPRYTPVFGIQIDLPRDWKSHRAVWRQIRGVGIGAASRRRGADPKRQSVRFDLAKPLALASR